MAATPLQRIVIAASSDNPSRGILAAPGLQVPCALGRTGRRHAKREGDGATPTGRIALVSMFYRPDRLRRPATRLPTAPLRPDLGWCDDPGHRAYNRPVRLPFAASHERLWRDDHLYDVLVVLNHNLAPTVPGAGSAIFLHLAAPGMTPTEGCVAIALPAMRTLLARAGPGSYLDIA